MPPVFGPNHYFPVWVAPWVAIVLVEAECGLKPGFGAGMNGVNQHDVGSLPPALGLPRLGGLTQTFHSPHKRHAHVGSLVISVPSASPTTTQMDLIAVRVMTQVRKTCG